MRLLVQRVKEANVAVDGKTIGEIKQGILALLGIHKDDTLEKIPYLVQKLINLRIFTDENDKMNRSLLDIKGEVLIVSQFTLYGNCKDGRRPEFTEAAAPELARDLYEKFVKAVEKEGVRVQTGSFGAYMQVSLVNDGPVTLLIDSKN